MRLSISKSKNSITYYVTEGFRDKNGKATSRVIKRLGSVKELKEKYGDDFDHEKWAREQVAKLNQDIKKNKPIQITILATLDESTDMGETRRFSIGDLILKRELNLLGLSEICKKISSKYKYKYEYDFKQILEHLVTSRILSPSSKYSTYEYARKYLLDPPTYELHDIYRALSVIAKESYFIQEQLFKHSDRNIPRNTSVLFYDCTNFFFEIDQEDELRKYGKSKENRPNPIVQLGLFIDGNGIPLAFDLFQGNKNEQLSLKPTFRS